MFQLEKRQIGSTDLYVTCLGLGCSGLAYSETVTQALKTFQTATKQGINYFDTAPRYGRGESELRLGKALSNYSGEKLTISTKVGWLLQPFLGERIWADFSRSAVLKSLNSSLQRLGVDAVDILFIHDPDNHYNKAIDSAYPALAELRDDGIVKAIGAGMNQWEMELRFAEEGDFDCFLLAGRYTLLEQGALDEFLPFCLDNKISIIIGGPYNSGVLADPKAGKYNYIKAPSEIVAKSLRLKEVCDKYAVPLKAVALQFVLAHPAVSSVIPGTRSPIHQNENFKMMNINIPKALWDELREEDLIDSNAPVPLETK
jgi:D-threo-aldose 1-dehydrogenase